MSAPLRIIFMGTPEFAVPSLEALLHTDFQDIGKVVGVVTQPDRPKGRGQQLTPPPIKLLAERHSLPVVQPLKMKDPVFLTTLQEWAPHLKKEDGALDWKSTPTALVNRVRGLTPWPGAYTYYGEERWLIRRTAPSETGSAEAEAGTILEALKDQIRVATASGSVLIHEL